MIRPTLLYGCETLPMSVKERMATTEMRMVRWTMVLAYLEHRRNEILIEAKVEPIATVMRREGWNGSGTLKEEMILKTSEQYLK